MRFKIITTVLSVVRGRGKKCDDFMLTNRLQTFSLYERTYQLLILSMIIIMGTFVSFFFPFHRNSI
jgi:hypothetical protein